MLPLGPWRLWKQEGSERNPSQTAPVWGCSSVVERMLCMYEALGSIPSISKFSFHPAALLRPRGDVAQQSPCRSFSPAQCVAGAHCTEGLWGFLLLSHLGTFKIPTQGAAWDSSG